MKGKSVHQILKTPAVVQHQVMNEAIALPSKKELKIEDTSYLLKLISKQNSSNKFTETNIVKCFDKYTAKKHYAMVQHDNNS